MITTGDFYALGQGLPLKSGSPATVLDELINYLVTNTYSKLPYLKARQSDPIAEIKAVLTADEIGQHAMKLRWRGWEPTGDQGNARLFASRGEPIACIALGCRRPFCGHSLGLEARVENSAPHRALVHGG